MRRRRGEILLYNLWLNAFFLGQSSIACFAPSRPLQTITGTCICNRHTINIYTNDKNGHCLCMNNNKYDDDFDEDDDDDDEPPEVDIANFNPNALSYGLNKGRSSPSHRKALGLSGMAKIHICTNCASEYVKWMGKCPTCQQWNTLQEHAVVRQTADAVSRPVFGTQHQSSWLSGVSENVSNAPVRMSDLLNATISSRLRRGRLLIPDDDELNNVLGGGIMQGSLTLIGGDPGVGKSTLMLQTAASLASPTPGIGMGPVDTDSIGPVWYVSGEENPEQIASRAARLGLENTGLWLLSETHVDTLCELIVSNMYPTNSKDESILQRPPPSLVVIDSIQTMICNAGGASAAGGVTQVRESVAMFLRLSKSTGIPIFLVGHVTKAGGVAGPRTVEHMVDCVLYLDGSGSGSMSNIRVLRASKNRFGSADEVGVYTMTSGRLLPVSDPSSMFLAHRVAHEDQEGCAIAIALEGMRAITVEVQALATKAGGAAGFGRRTVDGISTARLLLLMGVLQKRCGIFLNRHDVYMNVVGRMRLDRSEGNAADLAAAIALVSSLTNIPVRSDTAFVGEIGLLGEVRSVGMLEKRLNEARRMGFSRVVTPRQFRKGYIKNHGQSSLVNNIEWIQCDTLFEAINAGLVQPMPRKKKRMKATYAEETDVPGSLSELGLDQLIDDSDDDEHDSFM